MLVAMPLPLVVWHYGEVASVWYCRLNIDLGTSAPMYPRNVSESTLRVICRHNDKIYNHGRLGTSCERERDSRKLCTCQIFITFFSTSFAPFILFLSVGRNQ